VRRASRAVAHRNSLVCVGNDGINEIPLHTRAENGKAVVESPTRDAIVGLRIIASLSRVIMKRDEKKRKVRI